MSKKHPNERYLETAGSRDEAWEVAKVYAKLIIRPGSPFKGAWLVTVREIEQGVWWIVAVPDD